MARNLNGSSDHMDVAAGIVFPTTAMTWCCWFNNIVGGISAGQYEGLMVGNVSGAGIFIKANASSVLSVPFYIPVTGAPGNVNIDADSAPYSQAVWNNALSTYDTTNGLKGYVNGVSIGTAAANGNINFGSVKLDIGYDQNNAGRVLNGGIADCAIWNVVLSAIEISAIVKGARPFTIRPANLIFWAPLDGIQSPEPDLSGKKNNATLTGTSVFSSAPPLMQFTPRWPQKSLLPMLPAAGLGWIVERRNRLMKQK